MKNSLPTSKSASQFNPTSNGYHSDLTFDAVAAHYGQSGRHVRLSTSICHGGDTKTGLCISRGDHGGIIATCHTSGCAFTKICDALRLDMGLPPWEQKKAGPEDLTWTCTTADGIKALHVRYVPKDPTKGPKGYAWKHELNGRLVTTLPSGIPCADFLYRAGTGCETPLAVVCEGEKSADAMWQAWPSARVIGTCQGAPSTPNEAALVSALSGVRQVVLWPDNDDKGHEQMRRIALLLRQGIPDVGVHFVEVADLRERWDAADLPVPARVERVNEALLTPAQTGVDVVRAPESSKVPFAAKPLSEKGEARKRWLVEPWIRAGKLHSLGGKKGVGKSQILLWLAVQFFKRHRSGTILYFTFEDDELEDIKPRAIVAGVDLTRLIVINAATSFGDVDRIRDAVREFDARMIYFDTLQKYVENANADMNSTFGAQGQIAKIEALARETGVAVVVTRHHRKGKGFSADEADSGSAGISGAMRTVLTAGPYEQGAKGEYGLALAVGNHARHGGGIIYEMEPCKISYAGAMEETVRIKVVREDSTLSADDLVGGGGGERPKTDAEFAEEFLRDEYAGETKAYSETLQAACKDPDALFKYPTLKRVLKKLGWKVGPKESDASGKVGGQKSVWLAPETWAQIENELVYMPSQTPPPCTLIQGQQNQQLKPISEGEKGISVHVDNMYTNSKKAQNGVRQIENGGCPTHGKRAMPGLTCLVENCTHDERIKP